MLEEVPAEDAPFDAACGPGFCDGDWPPWLQKEILGERRGIRAVHAPGLQFN